MPIQRCDRPVMDQTNRIQTAFCLIAALALTTLALSVSADEASDINARLYKQLSGSETDAKIEKVSGQLYVSKEHMDAGVIGDALSAMLESQTGKDSTVAVQRGPSLNFEIHFKKNTAELTPESLSSLD